MTKRSQPSLGIGTDIMSTEACRQARAEHRKLVVEDWSF